MSARIQDWIYFTEEGTGAKLMQFAVAMLAFIALAVAYNINCFKNFGTEEAMDLSQLARNISEGEGYTTDHIRGISISTVNIQANKKSMEIQQEIHSGKLSALEKTKLEKQESEWRKLSKLKTAHPDLANAPAYPVLLAGFMKLAPINFEIPKKQSFFVYQPELWIAVFNQFLFFLSVLVLFNLARRLFDGLVATASAILFACTELFWRYSISGLPTMLLVLIFLCLAWSLFQFLRANEDKSARKIFLWAMTAGILTGIGCLTRYAFGWMLGPTLIFLFLFGKLHRIKMIFLTVIVFLLVISPWLVRNKSVSGHLFGIAGYAFCQNTTTFSENRLERSFHEGSIYGKVSFSDYLRKFVSNSRQMLEKEIPNLGGSWLMAFFLVGFMVSLAGTAQFKFRIFIVLSFVFMWVPQAMGRSHLTEDSPHLNSENLFILFSPVIFAFGTALYLELLRKIAFSSTSSAVGDVVKMSYIVTFLFGLLISAPLIFTLLPPAVSPLAYPPYHPPLIQENARWMRKNELVMSDVPWAVAWYGNRESVSLSLVYPTDFLRLNDDIRPVNALYLTPKTTDSRFLTELIKERDGWGRVVLEILTKGEVPNGFPLRKARSEFLPEHIFLTDWKRWSASSQ